MTRSLIRLAAQRLRRRKVTSTLIVLGLAMASTSLALMGGVSTSTRATLVWDVDRVWDTPYDILVRPAAGVSKLEREAGLVRPNFVTALHGGITLRQLEQIRALDDIAVAAPVAVVGFVYWPSGVIVPLENRRDDNAALYQIHAFVEGDSGLSR